MYKPDSEGFSGVSPDGVLSTGDDTGSTSDFSRVEGTSPFCLQ